VHLHDWQLLRYCLLPIAELRLPNSQIANRKSQIANNQTFSPSDLHTY